jgi:TatA/E family protein of Tat protein translocase
MFGMGMSEILIICAVALLVFGPQQLPEMAKKIAKGLKEVRKASDDLKRSINLDDDDDRPRWKPPTPRPPLMEAQKHFADDDGPPLIPGSALVNGLIEEAQPPSSSTPPPDDVPAVQAADAVAVDSALEEALEEAPEEALEEPEPTSRTTVKGV